MPLPCSGPISISQIRSELGTSSGSLRTLSSLAGFSTPDAMSEFYCYSNVTYTYYTYAYYIDPCAGATALYTGSNGRWYRSGDGINFTDVTGEFAALYGYFVWPDYLYNYYLLQVGPSFIYWGDTTSGCAPF
jgi:hypothetical protein